MGAHRIGESAKAESSIEEGHARDTQGTADARWAKKIRRGCNAGGRVVRKRSERRSLVARPVGASTARLACLACLACLIPSSRLQAAWMSRPADPQQGQQGQEADGNGAGAVAAVVGGGGSQRGPKSRPTSSERDSLAEPSLLLTSGFTNSISRISALPSAMTRRSAIVPLSALTAVANSPPFLMRATSHPPPSVPPVPAC